MNCNLWCKTFLDESALMWSKIWSIKKCTAPFISLIVYSTSLVNFLSNWLCLFTTTSNWIFTYYWEGNAIHFALKRALLLFYAYMLGYTKCEHWSLTLTKRCSVPLRFKLINHTSFFVRCKIISTAGQTDFQWIWSKIKSVYRHD